MSDSFPAAPGTAIIFAPDAPDDAPAVIPVVGWMNTKGARVAPLTAENSVAFKHGVALSIPGEQPGAALIHDPTFGRTFVSMTDWIAFLGTRDPADAEVVTEDSDTAFGVLFDTVKTYVKTSYWHFREGTKEVIFEVDGGELLPDDARVAKINRKDFMQLKKTVRVLRAEAISQPTPAPHPEDGFEDESDDDFEDLV